jgi:hypothetical protein
MEETGGTRELLGGYAAPVIMSNVTNIFQKECGSTGKSRKRGNDKSIKKVKDDASFLNRLRICLAHSFLEALQHMQS